MKETQGLGDASGGRTVTINWQHQNEGRYPGNKIHTTRYTWYNFVPIALLIQFTKVSNSFYALGAVL